MKEDYDKIEQTRHENKNNDRCPIEKKTECKPTITR